MAAITKLFNNSRFLRALMARTPFADSVQKSYELNHRFDTFYKIDQENNSKDSKAFSIAADAYINNPVLNNPSSLGFDNFQFRVYDIDYSKPSRLQDYRNIALFAEVSDALDEICDECICPDETTGEIIKLKVDVQHKNISEVEIKLKEEFRNFISIFQLHEKGWSYFRQFLIDGELFFENIIDDRRKDLGIIDALLLPTENIDPVYYSQQNLLIEQFVYKRDGVIAGEEEDYKTNDYFSQSKSIGKRLKKFQDPSKHQGQQLIIFPPSQITYIDSGIWDAKQLIKLPFLENCRRAYKQLSLIEDSILIYRIVRAPERLKFKIDVGNMPPAEAEMYVRQQMQQYWTKKTINTATGSTTDLQNLYNPQSMLDSYWFPRRAGSEGSDVEVLSAGQNLGEITDLNYFLSKLYRSLKVPISRLKHDQTYTDGDSILREELRFAKFIVRLQTQFASAIKKTFETHLKLKGLWDKLGLDTITFTLTFNVPNTFLAFREKQLAALKLDVLSSATNIDIISKLFALKKFFGMSNSEIIENVEFLRKDARLKWELAQIEQNGPKWREAFISSAEGSESGSGEASPVPGGGSGLGDMLSAMGGGNEAAPGGAPSGEMPPEFGQ